MLNACGVPIAPFGDVLLPDLPQLHLLYVDGSCTLRALSLERATTRARARARARVSTQRALPAASGGARTIGVDPRMMTHPKCAGAFGPTAPAPIFCITAQKGAGEGSGQPPWPEVLRSRRERL